MCVAVYIHSHFVFDFRLRLFSPSLSLTRSRSAITHFIWDYCVWWASKSKSMIIPQLFDNRTLMRTAHGKYTAAAYCLLNQIKTTQTPKASSKDEDDGKSVRELRQCKMRLYTKHNLHCTIDTYVLIFGLWTMGEMNACYDFQPRRECEPRIERERQSHQVISTWLILIVYKLWFFFHLSPFTLSLSHALCLYLVLNADLRRGLYFSSIPLLRACARSLIHTSIRMWICIVWIFSTFLLILCVCVSAFQFATWWYGKIQYLD